MKKTYLVLLLILGLTIRPKAQSQLHDIYETLYDYIEGTAIGDPDRLRGAFHKDFNLFLVADDTLRVIDGEGYINRVEHGKTYKRIGKIVSVDVENDAAMAKIEVYFPDSKRRATDYLLLLKTKERWKILHKIINLNSFEKVADLQVQNSNEVQSISLTLNRYINGTANNDYELLQQAFHKDFNLYYIKDGEITIIDGDRYLENFKGDKQNNRIGKILSVDYEDDAAVGKVQVLMPDRERIAIDYMLLLKVSGKWQIIHKSFASKSY